MVHNELEEKERKKGLETGGWAGKGGAGGNSRGSSFPAHASTTNSSAVWYSFTVPCQRLRTNFHLSVFLLSFGSMEPTIPKFGIFSQSSTDGKIFLELRPPAA